MSQNGNVAGTQMLLRPLSCKQLMLLPVHQEMFLNLLLEGRSPDLTLHLAEMHQRSELVNLFAVPCVYMFLMFLFIFEL